jgi:hypothetical protein
MVFQPPCRAITRSSGSKNPKEAKCWVNKKKDFWTTSEGQTSCSARQDWAGPAITTLRTKRY